MTALFEIGVSLNGISADSFVNKHKLFKQAYPSPISVGMATAENEIVVSHYGELPYKIGQFSNKLQLAIVLMGVTHFNVILCLPWMKKSKSSHP